MPFILFLAGLFFLLKDLVPVLKAQRSGVVQTRGHSPKRIVRADEPDRFEALIRKRYKGVGLGAILITVGVVWMALGIVGAAMTAAAA